MIRDCRTKTVPSGPPRCAPLDPPPAVSAHMPRREDLTTLGAVHVREAHEAAGVAGQERR